MPPSQSKPLDPTQQWAIAELFNNSVPVEKIARVLGVPIDHVRPYISHEARQQHKDRTVERVKERLGNE